MVTKVGEASKIKITDMVVERAPILTQKQVETIECLMQ